MTFSMDEKLRQFDLNHLDLLKEAGRHLLPALDEVLVRFYERALADGETVKYFPRPGQIDSARNAQKKHWQMLLSGDFGPNYIASTERIGRTHARIDLPLDMYLSAYACASSHLIEILFKKLNKGFLRRRSGRSAAVISALTRALALDTERVVDITFSVWGEEQTIAFDYLGVAIDKLASGDLGHVISGPQDSDFPKRYDNVRIKFNDSMRLLGTTIHKMSAAMQILSQLADDVTHSADQLSTRTVSQAASLEQTAAAMNEMTASVASSSEKTHQTTDVGEKAQAELENGADIIAHAARAMEAIKHSSDSISRITGMIDDVAFQTNLLALNAGVEAARAGDAGRGFAVVASEVRSLAVRSSEAAHEIKDLIQSSVKSVDEGVELIQKADLAFATVVSGFDSVTGLANEVAVATREQSQGLEEINSAVTEMDRITQMNAGMVEDTLRAMQAMRAQADELQNLASHLRFAPADDNIDNTYHTTMVA